MFDKPVYSTGASAPDCFSLTHSVPVRRTTLEGPRGSTTPVLSLGKTRDPVGPTTTGPDSPYLPWNVDGELSASVIRRRTVRDIIRVNYSHSHRPPSSPGVSSEYHPRGRSGSSVTPMSSSLVTLYSDGPRSTVFRSGIYSQTPPVLGTRKNASLQFTLVSSYPSSDCPPYRVPGPRRSVSLPPSPRPPDLSNPEAHFRCTPRLSARTRTPIPLYRG